MSDNIQPIGKKAENSVSGHNGKAGRIQQWAFDIQRGADGPIAVLRCWLRIFFIMRHEFVETSITLRASALTYAIVLSMVPMLAMSTAILKGLGSDNQLRIAAYRLIDQLEPNHGAPAHDKVGTENSSTRPAKKTCPSRA